VDRYRDSPAIVMNHDDVTTRLAIDLESASAEDCDQLSSAEL